MVRSVSSAYEPCDGRNRDESCGWPGSPAKALKVGDPSSTRTSASRTQLFFTTHDPLLLDQDLLRRDEVWFLDKQENGHSKLTALSDFKGVRYDKNIHKNYLLGRFAGVPAMRTLPRRVEEVVSPE